MKIERFSDLWTEGKPGQQKFEWFLFLKYMSDFWERNMIVNPVVVEIGIRRGRQKRFWEELGATHIGVDISDRYATPWITGDSHNPLVLNQVKSHLKSLRSDGMCDLLFIDGDHSFFGVRDDFEMYGDLAHMVALHDIHCLKKDVHVDEFWRKLRNDPATDFTFLEFFRPHPPHNYGIGLILKEI